jgi:hypothetical protein
VLVLTGGDEESFDLDEACIVELEARVPKPTANPEAVPRVKVANDDGSDAGDREPMWLVMEWPEGEAKPTKFILTTLGPSQ